MKIMPFSSGQSHNSASVDKGGYVVADLSRMKRVVRVDRRNRVALIERNGFREFYNSHGGKGCGVEDCGMATLEAEMLERTGG